MYVCMCGVCVYVWSVCMCVYMASNSPFDYKSAVSVLCMTCVCVCVCVGGGGEMGSCLVTNRNLDVHILKLTMK